MSLKILWLTSSFPAHPENGRNLYLWHPLSELKQQGIELIVLHTPAWKLYVSDVVRRDQFPVEIKTVRYLSIPRYYFRSLSNFFYSLWIVPKIKQLVKLHHFDIIHAHGEICGLAAVKASKQLKISTVVTIHGIDTCHRKWKGFSRKMFRNMFNEVNSIIYVGEPLQKYFQSMMNHNNHCRVVHNGFRLPDPISKDKIRNRDNLIQIISVSNLYEGKGVDLTLLTLAKLKEYGITNWTYTIIGDGDQKKLCTDIITKFHLEKKVMFKGNCTHDVVYTYLKNADIFCLPSYREAFGIAYVEAMAHGLLTIGVEGQGPQAYIEHGKTGFLVKPHDVETLSNVLKLAIMNFDEMQSIAQAGRQYVLSNFTWEKHAEKLISVYREVCGQ